MINQILEVIKKNKKPFMLISVVALLFIVISVATYGNTQSRRAAESAAQEQAQLSQESEASGAPFDASGQPIGDESTDAEDGVTYSTARDFDEKWKVETALAKETQEILMKSIWVSSDETAQITFYADRFIEARKSKKEATRYQITYVSKAEENMVLSYTVILETDRGDYLLHLNNIKNDTGPTSKWLVSSEAFFIEEEYKKAITEESFIVEEPPAIFPLTYPTVDVEAVKTALRTYGASNYPTANAASWDTVIVTDLEGETLVINFILNNSSASQINVAYSLSDNTAEVVEVN